MLKKHEVAKKYQVSHRTVGNWINKKVIPYVKIGNVVRFDPDEVEKALARHEVKARGYSQEGGQS